MRFLGCYDFVRTVRRGWDLLDFLDAMTLYALSRGGGILDFLDAMTLYALSRQGGIFQTSWML